MLSYGVQETLFTAVVAMCVCKVGSMEVFETIVGHTRVQMLSPTLLRIEPEGPMGFENRSTFMVSDRSFPGIRIVSRRDTSDHVLLSTAYYDVSLWPSFFVVQASGTAEVLYNSSHNGNASNVLSWPPPLTVNAYGIMDYPRFVVPEWGAAPPPPNAHLPPELVPTNGYDFRNNVIGDTYVFLLGSDLDSWTSARKEFLQLTGPTPLLPDFAFGTWFTWWHNYSDSEARQDVMLWQENDLPLDVFGLDMNWRDAHNWDAMWQVTPGDHPGVPAPDDWADFFYDRPAPWFKQVFTWLSWMKGKGIRTFFNDHPYPVSDRHAGGLQTSAEEIAFRWEGLTSLMSKGLTYWWFDANWDISIPPPMTEGHFHGKLSVAHSENKLSWCGMDNQAWGSHVYYTIVQEYNKRVRAVEGDTLYGGRALTLTKDGGPMLGFPVQGQWEAGWDPKFRAGSPAQHRYPVWWSGDGVELQAAVESMVDAGLYDFKPFDHSDCGGGNSDDPASLMRWTAFCSYGTIFRYHSGDHRPWRFDNETLATVRSYMQGRYRLMPSIVAAGHESTASGHPIVARCDFYWPEHPESSNNTQYMFLDDILVAPMWQMDSASRSVWLPPGFWQDHWTGEVVEGPQSVMVTQPSKRIPVWYRRGGLLVVVDEPRLRVDDQDWSSLTLEAYPTTEQNVSRTVYERGSSEQTRLLLSSSQSGVHLRIGSASDGSSRAWTLRLHLLPGQRATSAELDGQAVSVSHIQPSNGSGELQAHGSGSPPPHQAGPVAEIRLWPSPKERSLDVAVALAVWV